jgi:HK97 gp10 family phage protein
MKGLDKILANYKKFPDELKKKIAYTVSANALEGRNEAVKKAPIAFGKLRQSIAVEKVNEITQSVVVNADYAPYVEFGTGGKVEVPAEWQQIAEKFKGKGRLSFDEMLERVKQWCRLKGIDERAAYPILITNLKEGIEPRPFMYPAWQKVKKQFSRDMVKLMKYA